MPAAVAVIVMSPSVSPSVTKATADPSFRVTETGGEMTAPLVVVSANVTCTPGIGAPFSSRTWTTNGSGKSVSTAALWPSPLTMLIVVGVCAIGVSLRTRSFNASLT